MNTQVLFRAIRGTWRLFRMGLEAWPGLGLLVGALGSLGLFRALSWASRWQWRLVTLLEILACALAASVLSWVLWGWVDEAKKAKQETLKQNARLAGMCFTLAAVALFFAAWHFHRHPGARLALH